MYAYDYLNDLLQLEGIDLDAIDLFDPMQEELAGRALRIAAFVLYDPDCRKALLDHYPAIRVLLAMTMRSRSPDPEG